MQSKRKALLGFAAFVLAAATILLLIPWMLNSFLLTQTWFYVIWVLLIGIGFLLVSVGKKQKAGAVIVAALLVESIILSLLLLLTVFIFAAASAMP